MNIKDINLDELAKKLLIGSPISDDYIELINRILFKPSDKFLDCDIVMVLGNPTCLEDRIVKAIEIMQKNSAKYILLSGGVFLPQSIQTEALGMYNFCINCGIPKEKIIIENESTTTRENIILSAPLVSALNFSNPHIVTVSSATHIRRVSMNFEKFKRLFPENSTFSFCQSIHSSCDPSSWFLYDEAKKLVATELLLIKRYIYEYNYSSFDV